MNFSLEEIDLSKVKRLYFLRGFENKGEDNYCTSAVLVGDVEDGYEIKLLLSRKLLNIKDGKDLLKYLKQAGMKCHAEVLKVDFDKFYNKKAFERIKI